MGNKLGKEELAKLQVIMKAHITLQSLCGIAADATEANLSGLGMDAADAAVLADDIQDKGALSNLHVGQNSIPEEQMRAIIEMDKFDVLCAVPVKELKADSLKELDLSGKSLGVEGALVLSTCLHDNGALAKLDISSNQICGVFLEYDTWGEEKGTYDASGLEALAKAIGNLKEFNISSNLIKAEGAKILAPAIQDNGALASLDLSNNEIFCNVEDEGPAPVLAEALKNCTSLHTVLISSNYMKAIHAKILAPAIQDMGALAKLDISNNYHSGEHWDGGDTSKGSEEFIRPIASILKTNKTIKELNLAGNNLNAEAARIFSQDIHDNGALASLDISGNRIGREQEASIDWLVQTRGKRGDKTVGSR